MIQVKQFHICIRCVLHVESALAVAHVRSSLSLLLLLLLLIIVYYRLIVFLVTNNTALFTNVCETMLSYNIVTNVVAMPMLTTLQYVCTFTFC